LPGGPFSAYLFNLGVDYLSDQGNQVINDFATINGANMDSQSGQFGSDSTRGALTAATMLIGSGEAKVVSEAERFVLGRLRAEASAAEEGQMLFRGVGGNGTQKAILGEQGIAIPRGTALDESSLIKHVLGEDVNAGVTSWTTERSVAQRFSGPNGTIIEV